MNKYFVYDLAEKNVSVPVEVDYAENITWNNPTSNQYLNYAIWYDQYVHPDETYFVTTNSKVAEEANKYFGEDSIILI